ncbi:unnamed protein product, partial [Rotaria magnacalcarata]
MKTVTLDTQLHQAVLADTINIMKDFMQYVIPASLTASKNERSSLVQVANEYYNRLHVASSRLINGYQLNQLNHQVQLMSTSLHSSTVQTGQQSASKYNSTENANPRDEAMHQLEFWNFSPKDQKLVLSLLDEWYTGRTLNTVVEQWENVGTAPSKIQKEYIKILCYNVEGWGTRALEAIDLMYNIQASICIFTEVGELWNTCRSPHFNTFYQKGTNKNGGVCIAVGKHLKATRIEVNIPNTVVIDITGLSEPVRIIGIYWPTSQQRDLDEILSYVVEGTILSGDFNATVKEWNSPVTDKRGAHVKEWINESNLNYIPSTSNSSKRSLPNIQTSYDKSDKAFWTHLSRIYKSRTLPFYKLSDGTKIISTQQEITNELYQYYSEQFKASALDCSNEHVVQIDSEYKELLNKLAISRDKVEKTSTWEITQLIKTFKPKKSAGFDLVSNFIIKKLPPSYIECLANCFNTWLSECRYPEDWKIAKIITLNKLKSGIPKCEQTRPISLLATHSKLFEKVLLLRIRHWAETNLLVPLEQSGFRPKCLLPTRVLSIYQEVKNNMAANIPTLALYVDYQKAYDRV